VKKPVKPATANKKRTAPKKRVASLARVVAKPSPSDSMLLIGGLALVVLVLGDTLLLALSTRYLRV
jgi:beta-lactamase regulating signal transducer with metallopeptidase domain